MLKHEILREAKIIIYLVDTHVIKNIKVSIGNNILK